MMTKTERDCLTVLLGYAESKTEDGGKRPLVHMALAHKILHGETPLDLNHDPDEHEIDAMMAARYFPTAEA